MAVVSDYTAILSGQSRNDQGLVTQQAPITGHPIFVTYSFDTRPWGTVGGTTTQAFLDSFQPLTPAQQAAATKALGEWAAASGVVFLQVAPGLGDLEFGNYDFNKGGEFSASQAAGYAGLDGKVYIGSTSYAYTELFAHEIGHTLGLKHPFEGDPTLTPALDNYASTVMSYTPGGSSGETLGTLDVQAAAYLYGAPGSGGSQDASWSWNAATQTLTQVSTTVGDVVHGVGGNNVITAAASATVVAGTHGSDTITVGANGVVSAYASDATINATLGAGAKFYGGAGVDVVHGANNSLVFGGAANDVFYMPAGGNYQVAGGGGTDIAVVAQAKPAQLMSQDFGQSGTGYFIYNGSGQSQLFLGEAYIEFTDALYSTAKAAYIDAAGFVALRNGYDAVLRLSGSDAAHLAIAQLADSVDGGAVTTAGAVASVVVQARASSSVAVLAYQFFTGKTPGAAGMDYLVSPTGPNPNNLNAAYYQSFNIENRYINFAVNLGKNGEGASAFNASYGGLSLFDATKTAYTSIFGGVPSDQHIHDILDPVLSLNGQSFTRAQYFATYGGDGANGIGTKAAMVGWLMTEAEKADVGLYAKSDDAFLTDVANGQAAFGVDLIGVYGKAAYDVSG